MKASNNGTVQQCITNLLRMVRGECPFERCKGLDPSHTDKPTETVAPDVQQDVFWLLGIYEPRVAVDSVDVSRADAEGTLRITVNLEGGGAVSNG